MLFVRIDLIQGKSSDYRGAIGEVIYEAMLAILNVPKNDRFQVIAEHPEEVAARLKAEGLDVRYLAIDPDDHTTITAGTVAAQFGHLDISCEQRGHHRSSRRSDERPDQRSRSG